MMVKEQIYYTYFSLYKYEIILAALFDLIASCFNVLFPVLIKVFFENLQPLINENESEKYGRLRDILPDNLKPPLKKIAAETGQKLKVEIRKMEEDAITEMKKRGLNVIVPDENQAKKWREMMEKAYPEIKGTVIPGDWFDEALQIVKEHEK